LSTVDRLTFAGLGLFTDAGESKLIAYARERLATHKRPRRTVVLEKLPRNATGKIEGTKVTVP
jgi:acyl-coenzyme A synthetase/AMP-(fatty) acid ligase